jgi:hypothetical protein
LTRVSLAAVDERQYAAVDGVGVRPLTRVSLVAVDGVSLAAVDERQYAAVDGVSLRPLMMVTP